MAVFLWLNSRGAERCGVRRMGSARFRSEVVFQNVCGNGLSDWEAINKVTMTETDWMGQRSTLNGSWKWTRQGRSYRPLLLGT